MHDVSAAQLVIRLSITSGSSFITNARAYICGRKRKNSMKNTITGTRKSTPRATNRPLVSLSSGQTPIIRRLRRFRSRAHLKSIVRSVTVIVELIKFQKISDAPVNMWGMYKGLPSCSFSFLSSISMNLKIIGCCFKFTFRTKLSPRHFINPLSQTVLRKYIICACVYVCVCVCVIFPTH